MSLPCYYALGGINYKQGFATSCPQQSDRLQILDEAYLPSEMFNNEHFKQHRKDLLNGVWPKGCDICKHVEENDAGKSMRHDREADLTYLNDDGSVNFAGLKTVELRFSHSCNMSCLHCSAAFSSGWHSKLKRYQSDAEDAKYDLVQLTGAMHRRSADEDLTISISTARAIEIAEDLNKNFPNLERIDFAGGEVLYQKQFFPTLRKLSEHPNAKNILIIFHSNFNADFDPVELSELLCKFKIAKIMISVDAGPKIYAYFRDGDWHKLTSNIEKFKSVNKGKSEINLVCTTGVYQIMELRDVFEGFLSVHCDYINSSIIYTPHYLNPSLMKLHFAEYVDKEFEACYNVIDNELSKRIFDIEKYSKLKSYMGDKRTAHMWTDIMSARMALKDIENYVNNTNSDPKHWDSFMVYIEKTDKIWKQDFNNYFDNYKFLDRKIMHV